MTKKSKTSNSEKHHSSNDSSTLPVVQTLAPSSTPVQSPSSTKKSTKNVDPGKKKVSSKKEQKLLVKSKSEIIPNKSDLKEETLESISSDVFSSSGASGVQALFTELIEHSDSLLKQQKRMTSNLKKVFKSYNKECKEIKKASKKNKRKLNNGEKPKRPPSGFAKPTEISNVLCDFLDVEHGTLMARTEVTKRVTKYIKEAKLQVEQNRRRFIPDKKLGSILGKLDNTSIGKDGKTDHEKGYTYFNLQKYLSPQFIKNTNTNSN